MIGKLAKSKAGHDKDQIYLIIQEDKDFVYLVDGKIKKIENPKKKKKKHIQIINCYENVELTNRLLSSETITNEEVKYTIKISQNKNQI